MSKRFMPIADALLGLNPLSTKPALSMWQTGALEIPAYCRWRKPSTLDGYVAATRDREATLWGSLPNQHAVYGFSTEELTIDGILTMKNEPGRNVLVCAKSKDGDAACGRCHAESGGTDKMSDDKADKPLRCADTLLPAAAIRLLSVAYHRAIGS